MRSEPIPEIVFVRENNIVRSRNGMQYLTIASFSFRPRYQSEREGFH